jgi:hypothetical protein
MMVSKKQKKNEQEKNVRKKIQEKMKRVGKINKERGRGIMD